MTTLTASLTAIRYFTAQDPYYYTVDNRPLTDVSASLVTVAGYVDTRFGVASVNTSATPTLDLSVSSNFLLAPTANITSITLSNPYVTGANTFYVQFTQDVSARTIVWPASISWPAATAPTLTVTSGKKDLFKFVSFNGGTSYLGQIVGQNYT